MRQLTPEELRQRNKDVMRRLLPQRILLASVSFIATLVEKKRLYPAIREARHMWRLEVFQ